ncbi:EF-hand domain-containing protein [Primorskyibacter aestuariivivens]|uniref:EF-hand domain-containing protein n=1 Tax=Primorskyibacter aestuariivivens TaxID=1888912 RepID=UPI002300EC88|nr:EF-hand domain-containing protein [Primorskyibacter aestuariivivens]MDA7427970.1 EF-hand domain-containing protein [Primorskyibacter aestuariivivens]
MSKTRSTVIGAGLMAAIVLTLPATSAMARGGPSGGFGPAMLEFIDLDANGDGQLSTDEMANMAQAHFAKVDANGDGELSADELQAAAAERQARRVARMIETLDSDGNGTLSAEEMEAARDMRGGHGQRAGKDGEGHKKRWGWGKSNEERREARIERMFDRIDADGDGAISEAEYDEARAHMMKRRGGRYE